MKLRAAGFTLVETLVILVLVGIVLALLLGMWRGAREAGNRAAPLSFWNPLPSKRLPPPHKGMPNSL